MGRRRAAWLRNNPEAVDREMSEAEGGEWVVGQAGRGVVFRSWSAGGCASSLSWLQRDKTRSEEGDAVGDGKRRKLRFAQSKLNVAGSRTP